MVFKDAQLVTRGQKKPISYCIAPPQLPAWTTDTRFWPYHLNVAAEIDSHQPGNGFLIFYFQFSEFVWTVTSFWPKWHLVWSRLCCSLSGSWFHVLCVQRCSFTCLGCKPSYGYLSYSCLPVSSKQSCYSPLTSCINKTQRTAVHWIISLFSYGCRDSVALKLTKDVQMYIFFNM